MSYSKNSLATIAPQGVQIFTEFPINDNNVVAQATFTVSNANDSGEGSLRDAIAQGNATEGLDTITFNPSLSEATIALTSQLEITDSVRIEGLGAAALTIDAGGNSRVFLVDDGDPESAIEVEITGLTITGGLSQDTESEFGLGGGILNQEELTLTNSILSGNSADFAGGGIYNAGTLTIANSTISGNSTELYGGGILNYSYSIITLTDSTISGNSAAQGGGIYNFYGSITLTESTVSGNVAQVNGGGINNFYGSSIVLTGSTISENSAESGGGSIHNDGNIDLSDSTVSGNSAEYGGGIENSGTMILTNSILSDNSAELFGGSIENLGTMTLANSTISGNSAASGGGIDNFGTMTLTNSTISENSAESSGGGIENFGTMTLTNSTVSENSAELLVGGIDNFATMTLTNSIVANSVGTNNDDIFNTESGTIDLQGVNIIETSIGLDTENNPNLISADPILSPLQDNGGLTPTHLPLADSPAIDGGSNSAIAADALDLDGDGNTDESLPFDQRGEGFDRVINDTVDIGAVEVGNPTSTEVLNIDGNDNTTVTDGRLVFNFLSVAGSPFINPEPLLEGIVQGALDLDAVGATRTSGEELVNFLEGLI